MNTVTFDELRRHHCALVDLPSLRDLLQHGGDGGALVAPLSDDEAERCLRRRLSHEPSLAAALGVLERLLAYDFVAVDCRALEGNRRVKQGLEAGGALDLRQLVRAVALEPEHYRAAADAARQALGSGLLPDVSEPEERDVGYFNQLFSEWPALADAVGESGAARLIFLLELARAARVPALLHPAKDAYLEALAERLSETFLDALWDRVGRGTRRDAHEVLRGHALSVGGAIRPRLLQRARAAKSSVFGAFLAVHGTTPSYRFRRNLATVMHLCGHGTGEALLGAKNLLPDLRERAVSWGATLGTPEESQDGWTLHVMPSADWRESLDAKLEKLSFRGLRLVEPYVTLVTPVPAGATARVAAAAAEPASEPVAALPEAGASGSSPPLPPSAGVADL